MAEPLLETLGKSRRISEDLRKIERHDNQAGDIDRHIWVNYGGNSEPYGINYDKLADGNLISHVVTKDQEYKNLGIQLCIFDPLSPLDSFIRKIQKIKKIPGVAATLDDPRDEKQKKADERNNLFCVTGDISLPGPQQELHKYMGILGINDIGFGIVTIRPYGGMLEDKEYVPLYYSFLRQVWKITSPYDGEIFCPIPAPLALSRKTLDKWIDLMRNEVGANIELNPTKNYMKIVKHQNSKNKLPGLSAFA